MINDELTCGYCFLHFNWLNAERERGSPFSHPAGEDGNDLPEGIDCPGNGGSASNKGDQWYNRNTNRIS